MVQIIAGRRPGAKPLSEPIMFSLQIHICIAHSQWVKISYDKILQSLKAKRFIFKIIWSLWILTGVLAAVMPRHLSNFKAICWFNLLMSQLRDLTRSLDKTHCWILQLLYVFPNEAMDMIWFSYKNSWSCNFDVCWVRFPNFLFCALSAVFSATLFSCRKWLIIMLYWHEHSLLLAVLDSQHPNNHPSFMLLSFTGLHISHGRSGASKTISGTSGFGQNFYMNFK